MTRLCTYNHCIILVIQMLCNLCAFVTVIVSNGYMIIICYLPCSYQLSGEAGRKVTSCSHMTLCLMIMIDLHNNRSQSWWHFTLWWHYLMMELPVPIAVSKWGLPVTVNKSNWNPKLVNYIAHQLASDSHCYCWTFQNFLDISMHWSCRSWPITRISNHFLVDGEVWCKMIQ